VTGTPLDSINLYNHECQFGPNGCPFKNGTLGAMDMSVRGGTDKVRYFASAGYNNEIGVVSYNWQKLYTGRTNLDAFLTKTLTAKFNMGYVRRSYRAAQQPDPVDQFGNLVWGGPATLNTKWRGWQDAPPEGSAQVDNEQHVGRTTASIELRQTPTK